MFELSKLTVINRKVFLYFLQICSILSTLVLVTGVFSDPREVPGIALSILDVYLMIYSSVHLVLYATLILLMISVCIHVERSKITKLHGEPGLNVALKKYKNKYQYGTLFIPRYVSLEKYVGVI